MTTFDERDMAFENKFAHDAGMAFKAEMLRNKLIGLWAAGLLGKTGAAADEYAAAVAIADLEKPGSEDVVAKLVADLGSKASVDEIRAKLGEMLPQAKAPPRKSIRKQHASRAPICLNLKEIRKAAQVAGDGRFDLRETLNYLKVEMIG